MTSTGACSGTAWPELKARMGAQPGRTSGSGTPGRSSRSGSGGVRWRLTPALGDDELVLELIRRRIDALGLVGPAPPGGDRR
jgi:hypothetical protein